MYSHFPSIHTLVDDNLRVTYSNGSIFYTSGTLVISSGGFLEVPAGSISSPTLPGFVQVDPDGVVFFSAQRAIESLPLAQVFDDGGTVVVEDLRGTLNIIGSSIQDLVTNATYEEYFQGSEYCFDNLTFTPGNYNISSYCTFYCKGDFTIEAGATLSVRPIRNGAPNEQTYTPIGLLTSRFFAFGAGNNGKGHPWSVQQVGTGGSSGSIFINTSTIGVVPLLLAPGGDSGGCIRVFAKGKITVNGTIDVSGQAPWRATNGFKNTFTGVASGAGGGSGGFILLDSEGTVELGNSCVLDVRGGDGAQAFSNLPSRVSGQPAIVSFPGSGGAAGHVRVSARSLIGTWSSDTSTRKGGSGGVPKGHISYNSSNNTFTVDTTDGQILVTGGIGGGSPTYRTNPGTNRGNAGSARLSGGVWSILDANSTSDIEFHDKETGVTTG